ncbi:MAG: hypothetical protein JWM76_2303 [Pseudonocardiales bacterium]|nr:hypothetical protein [Pseudonocardiales bacterium]
MAATFDTVIRAFGNNTGIEVPAQVLAELGAGKRPRVRISVNGYVFATTVGVMGGLALVPLSKAHRDASGLRGGQEVHLVLDLDDEPAEIPVPPGLAAALAVAGLTDTFAKLAPSRRKEYGRQITEAKAEQTRTRRIEKIIAELS